MGGLIALAILIAVIICYPTPPRGEMPSSKDPRQEYIERKTGECSAVGGVAQLHPISGYLGCNMPLKR